MESDNLELIPENYYDFHRAKLSLSLKWLLHKAYNGNVPADFLEPLPTQENDTVSIAHVNVGVLSLLIAGRLYCSACQRLFPAWGVQFDGHWSVIQALSRHGIYTLTDDDAAVTEMDLVEIQPFNTKAHLALIDAIMMACVNETAPITKIVQSVRSIGTFNASKELPCSSEDALFLWMGKVWSATSEARHKARQVQVLQQGLCTVRINKKQLAAHKPASSDVLLPRSGLTNLQDGCHLAVLVSFYCPHLLKMEDIRLMPPLPPQGAADVVHNCCLVGEFCRQWCLQTNSSAICFHFTAEDFLYSSLSIKPNVLVLLAELFSTFNGSAVGTLSKLRDGAPAPSSLINNASASPSAKAAAGTPSKLALAVGSSGELISSATKRSFLGASNATCGEHHGSRGAGETERSRASGAADSESKDVTLVDASVAATLTSIPHRQPLLSKRQKGHLLSAVTTAVPEGGLCKSSSLNSLTESVPIKQSMLAWESNNGERAVNSRDAEMEAAERLESGTSDVCSSRWGSHQLVAKACEIMAMDDDGDLALPAEADLLSSVPLADNCKPAADDRHLGCDLLQLHSSRRARVAGDRASPDGTDADETAASASVSTARSLPSSMAATIEELWDGDQHNGPLNSFFLCRDAAIPSAATRKEDSGAYDEAVLLDRLASSTQCIDRESVVATPSIGSGQDASVKGMSPTISFAELVQLNAEAAVRGLTVSSPSTFSFSTLPGDEQRAVPTGAMSLKSEFMKSKSQGTAKPPKKTTFALKQTTWLESAKLKNGSAELELSETVTEEAADAGGRQQHADVRLLLAERRRAIEVARQQEDVRRGEAREEISHEAFLQAVLKKSKESDRGRAVANIALAKTQTTTSSNASAKERLSRSEIASGSASAEEHLSRSEITKGISSLEEKWRRANEAKTKVGVRPQVPLVTDAFTTRPQVPLVTDAFTTRPQVPLVTDAFTTAVAASVFAKFEDTSNKPTSNGVDAAVDNERVDGEDFESLDEYSTSLDKLSCSLSELQGELAKLALKQKHMEDFSAASVLVTSRHPMYVRAIDGPPDGVEAAAVPPQQHLAVAPLAASRRSPPERGATVPVVAMPRLNRTVGEAAGSPSVDRQDMPPVPAPRGVHQQRVAVPVLESSQPNLPAAATPSLHKPVPLRLDAPISGSELGLVGSSELVPDHSLMGCYNGSKQTNLDNLRPFASSSATSTKRQAVQNEVATSRHGTVRTSTSEGKRASSHASEPRVAKAGSASEGRFADTFVNAPIASLRTSDATSIVRDRAEEILRGDAFFLPVEAQEAARALLGQNSYMPVQDSLPDRGEPTATGQKRATWDNLSPEGAAHIVAVGSEHIFQAVISVEQPDEETGNDEDLQRKRERIAMLQLRRREDSERRRQLKETEVERKREEQRIKETEAEQRKTEEKQRREQIFQQYKERKTEKDVPRDSRLTAPVQMRSKTTALRSNPAANLNRHSSGATLGGQVDFLSPSRDTSDGYGALTHRRPITPSLSTSDIAGSISSSARPFKRTTHQPVEPMLLRGSSARQQYTSSGAVTPTLQLAGSACHADANGDALIFGGDPSGGGLKLYVQPSFKSNRGIIINAISHCVLAGTVNVDFKNKVLEELARSDAKHFLILFRDAHLQYRGIYSLNVDTEEVSKVSGQGPKAIADKMLERFYKYNSGSKSFSEVTSTKHLSVSIDAITIKDALWQKKPGAALTTPKKGVQ